MHQISSKVSRTSMMAAYLTSTEEDSQFGLANIPFGVVSTQHNPAPTIATRYLGQVFLLPELIKNGHLNSIDEQTRTTLLQPTLNSFARLGRLAHKQVRECLQTLLSNHKCVADCAVTVSEVNYHLPVTVGDFSDFSCSRDHVLNAGEAVLGKRELPPGFLHFPIGYGGRCSSIVPPETAIRRPLGQFRTPEGVKFGPSRTVDFELEVACVIGKPSGFGKPIDVTEAGDHIFGFLLLNDWSARDVQGLEMNPLGPFNGKSFGTSVSPWIITADALEPFLVAGIQKEGEMASYLQSSRTNSHYAVELRASIESDGTATTVCKSRLDWLYWSVNEMIAHQTINGCPLNPGDIVATGTVSGTAAGSQGCLLEMTRGGKEAVALNDGGKRVYLQDGDAVRLQGWAGELGAASCVGFGSCFGQLLGNELTNGH